MKFTLIHIILASLLLLSCSGIPERSKLNQDSKTIVEGNGTGIQGVLKITSVNPSKVNLYVPTDIAVSGENFKNGITVKIAGLPCEQVSYLSDNQVNCLLSALDPSTPAPTGNVVVTNPKGDSASFDIDFWITMSEVGAPSPRAHHTAVWSGSKMIVFGGTGSGGANVFNTGGIFDPISNSWSELSTLNAPAARWMHTAVWTGSKMIVFGGWDENSDSQLNTGGIYDSVANNWEVMSTEGAPRPRFRHTAIWTGTKMIIFGGTGTVKETNLNTGGLFDPKNNTWSPTSLFEAPLGRHFQTSVWTGTEMLIFGGNVEKTYSASAVSIWMTNTGARYNPELDRWSPMSTVGAPSPRLWATGVWSGKEMYVFGGQASDNSYDYSYTASGGRYNPELDSWVTLSSVNAPKARAHHVSIWNGTKLFVMGGDNSNGERYSGAIYNPATESWSSTTLLNAPEFGSNSTAVWTGSNLLYYGGIGTSRTINSGAIYTPAIEKP